MYCNKLIRPFIYALLLIFSYSAQAQIFHINTINCKLSNADTALLNKMARFEANFYNQVFKTHKNDSVTIDINLYGKRKEYNQIQKDEMNTTFIDGFYSPMQNKIFLYKGDEYMNALFHESSHNLLRYNYANPPKWLNEGIATLLGYLVETTDNRILYMPQSRYIRQLKDSIRAHQFNLGDFFRSKNTDWFDKDKRPMLYATSYCVIYFLINQDKDYLTTILVLMKKGYSTSRAFKETFGSTDNFGQQFYDFYTRGPGTQF
jgi:hypothetical protein